MDMDPDVVRQFIDGVDGRWELAVLANLEDNGPMGPGLLRRSINRQRDSGEGRLSHKVLDATLVRMLAADLIIRREGLGFPRTVRYELTDWGMEHIAALCGLQAWYEARLRARKRSRGLILRRLSGPTATSPRPRDPEGPDTAPTQSPPQPGPGPG